MIIIREKKRFAKKRPDETATRISGLSSCTNKQRLMKKAEYEQNKILSQIKYEEFCKKRSGDQREERRNKR